MKSKLIVGLLVAAACAGCASGGSGPAGFGSRQERQRENIREGVREGDLTREEAARLREQNRKLGEARQGARDDGGISPAERRVLKKGQKKVGDRIYRQRHDAEQR